MRDTPSILPLIVRSLTFEADGRRLIDGVSFDLPKGGVTAIIGPNGAGKSLTLRLCHGLLMPSSGSIAWSAPADGAHSRRRAMVFQRPVMLRRTAHANIVHALKAMGETTPAPRAREALDRFGLAALGEIPARLLSGGEQQRLAIARAWALRPEVLLLDEPSSQLDPGATRQIEEIIVALSAEGMTIVMTTHDLGQARRLAGRIMFLNRGKLVEDAPAETFFKAPATAEARAFIGGDLLW